MLSFAPHASAALANKVLALFVLLLVAYASISITRMLVLFFDENMTEITEAADKQKKTTIRCFSLPKIFPGILKKQ